MRVFYGLDSIPDHWGPTAVTIGKFDGVHEGHRAIIRELERLAGSAPEPLKMVVVTFDRHPLSVLDPDRVPAPLTSTEQKLELLSHTPIDACVVLEFTPELASTEPETFVCDILGEALDARIVLVGADFRFGKNSRGDVDLLEQLGQQHGFNVVVLSDVVRAHSRASSTRVRELLQAGLIREASHVLGYNPFMRGSVVHGAKRGRELGFPTANLAEDAAGCAPEDGVYAGWLHDGDVRYPAAISVGNNPTFEDVHRKQVEAYVLDKTLDLYEHIVDVEFVDRIRGQITFDGVEGLIAQMHRDVEDVRRILEQQA